MSQTQGWRVGLATSQAERHLTADDMMMLPHLSALGVTTEPLIWTDPDQDLGRFDAILVRSTWDYHLHYPEFLGWLDALESAGTAVWNEPDTMRWNSNKLYLLELREGGIVIPETHAITHPDQEIPPALSGRPVVLKPAVSAGAFRTVHVDAPDPADLSSALGHILSHSPAIRQEFMPELQTEGEYSFVFIEGIYSHTVLKRPADGDFRVQEELGGTMSSITPSQSLRSQAEAVIRMLDPIPLYARVDGVRRGQTLVIMELELIEPSLYFLHFPAAAEVFARACRDRLSQHG